MLTQPKPIRASDLMEIVADLVAWQGGSGYEWQCDALIGAEALEALVWLAAHAPATYKRQWIKHLRGQSC